MAAVAASEIHTAAESWQSLIWLIGWPEQPWLRAIWAAALAVILVVLWDWLLRNLREPSECQDPAETSADSSKSYGIDWRSYLWRVSVAVLTGLIPVITLLGPKHGSQPTYPVVVTLVLVVVALAALQLYGQNRENLERIESKNNFDEQATRIDRIGVGVESIVVGVESVLAAIQGGAGNDIEVEASKQTEGRDEELGDPAPSSKLEATAKASKQTIYEDSKRRIQQNIPISSQLKEGFLEDTKTASLLKVDYREKYDEDDENFLEYLRDDYENWIHKFLQAFSITEPHLEGSLKTRWPLFTGLIGTSYNFGVDWTRKHESLIIPEANINKLVDSWILKLNLNSRRDDEMYPYLKNAIESSIRFGVQKSISDLLAGPQRLPD